jgi:hypothetical protein
MFLGLAGSRNNFTFELFFKSFSLHFQHFCVNYFTALFDFGFDHFGNWFDN